MHKWAPTGNCKFSNGSRFFSVTDCLVINGQQGLCIQAVAVHSCINLFRPVLLLLLLLLLLGAAVSDMANGGQILLDARCCAGVRDRLTELGAVDARGYNDMQLAHAARAAMRQQTSGLLSSCLG
jgi:hypothetical protein